MNGRTTRAVMLTVNTDNPAFDGDPRGEVARILAEAAQRVADGGQLPIPLFDKSGRRVGEVTGKME